MLDIRWDDEASDRVSKGGGGGERIDSTQLWQCINTDVGEGGGGWRGWGRCVSLAEPTALGVVTQFLLQLHCLAPCRG